MAAVGFEPTPPKRLVPKTSALDRSATLPVRQKCYKQSAVRFRDHVPPHPGGSDAKQSEQRPEVKLCRRVITC